MPCELSPLVKTKFRRIANPPREAECTARLLLMQVILVCVVHAAQKTWHAQRMACDDRPEEPGDGASLTPGPADSPGIPLRVLWECIAGFGGLQHFLPAVTVLPADTGLCRWLG
ncbi:MAG: hypothetical protein Q7T80_16495 [Methanoregula sp.]|nr:hypothetical protein [Methanoregula sp.]